MDEKVFVIMRGWLRLILAAFLLGGIVFISRVSPVVENAKAQVGPPTSINSCDNIAQNLQIPGQPANPARIIQCRDDVNWWDNIQGSFVSAVMVTVEFPRITDLYLEYSGTFQANTPGYYECTRPGSFPQTCDAQDFAHRYQYDGGVANWVTAAGTTHNGVPAYFSNFYLNSPCAVTGSNFTGYLGGSGSQQISFPCQTSKIQNGAHDWWRWNIFNYGFQDPRKRYDVTDQRLLVFQRNLSANLFANPDYIAAGQTSTLTWNTTGANQVSIQPELGSVALSGSAVVHPTTRTTYTLTATAGTNQITRTFTVHVRPSASLSANPTTTTPSAGSLLTWTTQGADSVTVVPDIGLRPPLPLSGHQQVYPATTTTYTLTATNQDGQTTAQATVSIDCGHTSGNGTGFIEKIFFRRAVAAACLPDLVPDLSQVTATVNGVSGSGAKIYLGLNHSDVVIKNLVVKNIGTADLPAASLTEVTVVPNYEVNGVTDVGTPTTAYINRAIPAGGQITLDPITIPYSQIVTDNGNGFFSHATKELGKASANLAFGVDTKETVNEEDEENNVASRPDFFTWPAAKVTVTDVSDGQPINEAIVTIHGDVVVSAYAEKTDTAGQAYLAMLGRPEDKTNYQIIATDGSDNGLTNMAVSDYRLYDVSVSINKEEGLNITPIATLQDYEKGDPKSFVPFDDISSYFESGSVTITTDTGTTLTANLTGPKVKFTDLASDVSFVYLKDIKANLHYDTGEFSSTVHYTWTEKDNGPLKIENNSSSVNEVQLTFKPQCLTQVTPTLQICFYEEPDQIEKAKTTYLPAFTSVLKRLTSFDPSVRLTVTKQVWVVPFDPGIGHFDDKHPQYTWVTGRYALADQLIASDLLMHESMHAIDYQLNNFFSENNAYYSQSATITAKGSPDHTLTDATGKWAWASIGTTCALMPAASQPHCGSHSDPADGPAEIFAEQAVDICLLPQAEENAFNQVANIWTARNPGQAVPIDLLAHRDVIASRSYWSGANHFGSGYMIYNYQNGAPVIGYNYLLQQLMRNCQGHQISGGR